MTKGATVTRTAAPPAAGERGTDGQVVLGQLTALLLLRQPDQNIRSHLIEDLLELGRRRCQISLPLRLA